MDYRTLAKVSKLLLNQEPALDKTQVAQLTAQLEASETYEAKREKVRTLLKDEELTDNIMEIFS